MGLLNKQIAYELGIGEATVKALVSAVLRKSGAINRSQVVLIVHGICLNSELEKDRAAARIRKNATPKLRPSTWAWAVGRDCHEEPRT